MFDEFSPGIWIFPCLLALLALKMKKTDIIACVNLLIPPVQIMPSVLKWHHIAKYNPILAIRAKQARHKALTFLMHV